MFVRGWWLLHNLWLEEVAHSGSESPGVPDPLFRPDSPFASLDSRDLGLRNVEQVADLSLFPVDVHLDAIDVIRPQPAAPPDDAGTRRGPIDDRLPFRFQGGEKLVGKPVHVVQKDEARDRALVRSVS